MDIWASKVNHLVDETNLGIPGIDSHKLPAEVTGSLRQTHTICSWDTCVPVFLNQEIHNRFYTR